MYQSRCYDLCCYGFEATTMPEALLATWSAKPTLHPIRHNLLCNPVVQTREFQVWPHAKLMCDHNGKVCFCCILDLSKETMNNNYSKKTVLQLWWQILAAERSHFSFRPVTAITLSHLQPLNLTACWTNSACSRRFWFLSCWLPLDLSENLDSGLKHSIKLLLTFIGGFAVGRKGVQFERKIWPWQLGILLGVEIREKQTASKKHVRIKNWCLDH